MDDAIIYIKIFLEKDSLKCIINYQIHLDKAKTIKELSENYNIVLSFFNRFFRDDIIKSDNGIDIKNIKIYFAMSIERYKKVGIYRKGI